MYHSLVPSHSHKPEKASRQYRAEEGDRQKEEIKKGRKQRKMPHRTIRVPLKLRLREILPKHNDNEGRYERIDQDKKPPGVDELLQIGV